VVSHPSRKKRGKDGAPSIYGRDRRSKRRVGHPPYSLWFAYYNFCRVHQTLKVTPAMESGLTGRVWEISDLLTA
jgi:hypothetical protein